MPNSFVMCCPKCFWFGISVQGVFSLEMKRCCFSTHLWPSSSLTGSAWFCRGHLQEVCAICDIPQLLFQWKFLWSVGSRMVDLHLLIKKFKILEPSYVHDRKITFTVTNRWHSKTEQSGFRSTRKEGNPAVDCCTSVEIRACTSRVINELSELCCIIPSKRKCCCPVACFNWGSRDRRHLCSWESEN